MSGLSGNRYKVFTPTDEAIAKQEGKPTDAQFTEIPGIQENDFQRSLSEVDVTDKQDNENKTLLAGAGIKERTLNFNGFVETSDHYKLLEKLMEDVALVWFRIVRPDGVTKNFRGLITSFNDDGAVGGSFNFSATVMMSGGFVD